MNDFIQLKQDNILRIGIKDSQGNDTGEHLEFDLEDIELPFKIMECKKLHTKNINALKTKIEGIDKKQDFKKTSELMSNNEILKFEALKEFYAKEEEALDMFLGENGTKKLLNGRKPYYSMYEDISEMLEPIMPKLTERANSINDKIKAKYGNKKEDNVL